MRSLCLLLSVALLSLTTLAFAQARSAQGRLTRVPPEAQKSFTNEKPGGKLGRPRDRRRRARYVGRQALARLDARDLQGKRAGA